MCERKDQWIWWLSVVGSGRRKEARKYFQSVSAFYIERGPGENLRSKEG